MSKELKNIEANENAAKEEAVEVETKQGFVSKVGGWCKKHGKKILTGVGIAAVGVVGYALGKKTAGECDYYEDEADFELDEGDYVVDEADSE